MSYSKIGKLGGGGGALLNSYGPQYLFTKAILIDLNSAHVYQIPSNIVDLNLNSIELYDLFSKQKNAFVLLGELLYHDKDKKEVTLDTQIFLSYHHCIEMRGICHGPVQGRWKEALPSVEALLEALKLRKYLTETVESQTETTSTSLDHRVSQDTKNQSFPQDFMPVLDKAEQRLYTNKTKAFRVEL